MLAVVAALLFARVDGFEVGRHPASGSTATKQRLSLKSSPSSTRRTDDANTKPTKRRQTHNNFQPNARFVAISVLSDAAVAKTFATRELEGSVHYQTLEPRDRAFARLLVATVERRMGQIDKVLDCCIDKPNKGKHAHVLRATLRTGVAQLLFLRTPPFAAIKETVQVLRISSSSNKPPVPEPMIKFVNGVLRKLSRPIDGEKADEDDSTTEMYGEMLLREKTSPQDNISPWLLDRWRNDWGNEATELICREMIPPDDTTVTSRIDLSTKYSLTAAIGMNDYVNEIQTLMSSLGDDAILLPQFSIRVGASMKGDVKLWPNYDDGSWWVQDASSTLPALVLSSALHKMNPQSDFSKLHFVDMCSAPGGKASQLLSVGFGHVTAIEANPRRSLRLIENLERLDLNDRCEVVVDEGQHWLPTRPVHGILLDVPCSATGTGARRPDVLRRDSDLTQLTIIQEKLANHCADKILADGGVMVYATCSLLKEESEDQVQKLIERGNIETLPIQSHEVPGFGDAIDSNGWLRVLPGLLGGDLRSTDGFFVARLIRKK
jgi:16S rRNA (cytosine967-C5)-methyltransferase